ncbi:MAG: TIGR04211 family SH3 domain-containing protein [Deltaproteobacteria bacterium]|nr:TIGR04211 family SH3 domain-containing protein [Deltaproteobacteria bacterium]
MNKFRFIIPMIFGLCLIGQTSWAETHYITDMFKTGLRTGPSVKNKIIRFLTSGQPVEFLESQEGWTHVRVLEMDANHMEEGWVLSRYLIKRLPWKDVVPPLREKNVVLKEKLERTEKECNEISQNEQRLKEVLEQQTDALQKLQHEYETLKAGSNDFLRLKEEQKSTRTLLKANEEMKKILINENDELRLSQKYNWLAMGALVLLCGIMIGIAVGKTRKKSSFH